MSNLSKDIQLLFHHTIVEGSEDSYKELFQALFPALFRFATCLLHSLEQAEEVASDVMLRLWQSRMQMTEVENIKMYALIMVRNQSLNIVKKNSRARIISLEDIEGEAVYSGQDPEQALVQSQLHLKIQEAIQHLPVRSRLVFRLVKEEGLSYKQVAELLSISVKTVDAHLVAAMRKLTEALRVRSDRA